MADPTVRCTAAAVSLWPPEDIWRPAEDGVCLPPQDEGIAESSDPFILGEATFPRAISAAKPMHQSDRLTWLSSLFLGRPFLPDPLGEGRGAAIDPDPMYRFDALDCMTYIEIVMALAASKDEREFEENLRDIRYFGGIPSYFMRKHFFEHWLPANEKAGWVEDITKNVGVEKVKKLGAVIDPVDWMMAKDELTPAQREEAASDLAGIGLGEPTLVEMDYIPISAMLAFDGEHPSIENSIAERLPEFSIIVFLRPEKAAREIGVIVAHLGFVIRPRQPDGTLGEPVLRHSTQRAGLFRDEDLASYLKSQEAYRAGVKIVKIEDR